MGRGRPVGGACRGKIEHRLLTREDEAALAARIQAGGPDGLAARNELVECNLGLAGHIAGFYAAHGHSEEDLLQAGFVGLIDAAQRYRPAEHDGVRFSTYAVYWIKNRIRDWLLGEPIVCTPHYWNNPNSVAFRRPRNAASAKRLRLNKRHFDDAQRRYLCFVADQDNEDDSDGVREPDDYRPLSPDPVIQAEDHAAIADAMDSLTPLEHEVIERRYGLTGRPAETLLTAATAMGFSREYIRLLEKRGMAKLRDLMGAPNCA